MRRLDPTTLERFVAASPLRVQLVDMHTGAPPKYAVTTTVERVNPGGPEPMAVANKITAAGVMSFVGLGQSHTAGPGIDLRIKVEAEGTVSETSTGTEWFEVTVPLWTSAAPPAVVDEEFRFFPAPNYRFGPAMNIANGKVVDAAAEPVSRASVSCTENINSSVLVEECRTDELGNFRLPLRWSGGDTVISAQHELTSGVANVVVPIGLINQVSITVT